MKRSSLVVLLFFLCSLTNAQGLRESPNTQQAVKSDTIPEVVYINGKKDTSRKPIISLNGKYVPYAIVNTLDYEAIDSLYVEHKIVVYKGNKYNGQINLRTSPDYKPEVITLEELKNKYTLLNKGNSCIYMIDGKVINADSQTYPVNKNYILKITISELDQVNPSRNLYLVDILTRSPSNVNNSKEIIVRGGGDLTMN